MADIAKPALVTELLSGEDGPYDPGYPRWSPEHGIMQAFKGDTPTNREWLAKVKKAQSSQRMAWAW